ncbi:MAG: MBOAT family protein [Dongiaceae bacterium]
MLFNSVQFIFLFLPLTLILFFAVARYSHRAAAGLLTLASLIFYATWRIEFLPLLLASILGNFLIGQRILGARLSKPRAAQGWLVLGVAANLLLLGWYKYAGFFAVNLQALAGWPHEALSIVLPLGISFFTFTQIAYLVDARRGLVDESAAQGSRLTHYALFVSYFPHLIAGPILHHREMMPQFAQPRTYRCSWENLAVGLTIFAIGLFKKAVIADALAPYVNAGFDQAAQGNVPGATAAWLSVIAYSLQIYFDFSGYSDMAIGASRLFGIHLPINFNSPYQATSIIDFWKRWHMTLSRFLRDYLYIPLGGNRHGATRRYVNLMIVMLLGGLWHGAGWTYVIWGGLHGLYLVVNHLWRRLRGRSAAPGTGLGRFGAQLITFLAVVVAWTFFRADDTATAGHLLAGMVGQYGLGTLDAPAIHLIRLCVPLLLIAWFAPNSQQIMAQYHVAPDEEDAADLAATASTPGAWWQWRPDWRHGLVFSAGFAAALYLIVFTHRISDFLYFQF